MKVLVEYQFFSEGKMDEENTMDLNVIYQNIINESNQKMNRLKKVMKKQIKKKLLKISVHCKAKRKNSYPTIILSLDLFLIIKKLTFLNQFA